VFTTVSDITAREAERLLGRKPEPLLPNGIDLEVVDELAGDVRAMRAQEGPRPRAAFPRTVTGDAALLILSGRYEFHNKGIDSLLEALARSTRGRASRIVQLLSVPAGSPA
jgi:phosphorylase/glycogen(starch) synthase